MPRDMIENERSSAVNPSEATEEKASLSDRFGLWLGFHPCGKDEYLAIIRGYCDRFGLEISDDDLRAEAIEWRQTRGTVSGRVPGNTCRTSGRPLRSCGERLKLFSGVACRALAQCAQALDQGQARHLDEAELAR